MSSRSAATDAGQDLDRDRPLQRTATPLPLAAFVHPLPNMERTGEVKRLCLGRTSEMPGQ
ncbi:MAG: hypothetical protein ACRD3C_24050 [Vicinamibacterales bacterium]